jgi:6-phosphogluconolactonase
MMTRSLGMSRRTLLRHAAGCGVLLAQRAVLAAGKQYVVYLGTYTAPDPRYGGSAESKGIYFSRFDSGTGVFSKPELAVEAKDPSYLVFHPSRRYLYAVNEEVDQKMGHVSAFSIDRASGRLTLLNQVSSKGGMPCHINTDKKGSVVAVANWSTGSTVTFPVRRDGSLGEAATFYQHSGERSGVPPGGAPVQVHCHSVNVSADNRFLIATDTGLNKVFVHRLDVAKATFTPHDPPYLGLKHQANPRQLAFHPNGKWAYIANESGPGCTMLRYDPRRGVFEEGPTARTVPESHTGRVTPAEIAMHPTGRFVYVSNRGHDSIAVMKIDSSNGSLALVEAFQPGGNGPRSFNIDPTGGFLLALMQRSSFMVPLKIDVETGRLTPAGDKLTVPVPVCAKFLEVG